MDNESGAVLLALDDVVKAAESEDNAVFARAAQAFLRELEAQTVARGFSEWIRSRLSWRSSRRSKQIAISNAPQRSGRFRLYITFQRHEQASLN